MSKALGLRHKALGWPVVTSRQRKKERGQALVELAIVLPILLLILMGIFDFGRIFHGYLSVTTAAREAARQASLGRTDAEIYATAFASATPLEAAQLVVTVTPGFNTRTPGTNIEVIIKYQYKILTPIMQKFLPNPFVVIGKAVMKRE